MACTNKNFKKKGKEMKKIMVVIILALLTVPQIVFCGSTQVDALIEKMVEKGIINRAEVLKLKEDIIDDEKIAAAENIDKILPSWVKNTKLKGDFRFRHQREKVENSTERFRKRIRFRLGTETKVNDNAKLFFGFATGGTDPRSTNQTFENTFELKDIRLDYVYAELIPYEGKILTLGRMKNPVWEPGDLLWDTDINPEGAALAVKNKLGSSIDIYMNSGVFFLDENKVDKDPWMFFAEPGVKWNINDDVNLNIAASYFGFENVKGYNLDNSSFTNTGRNKDAAKDKGYTNDYDALNPNIEITFKNLVNEIPVFSIFGEHVRNNTVSKDNIGTLAGVKFGHNKINDAGQWQVKYMNKKLEKDAWLDTFSDSDTYGGKTGTIGNEFIFSLGLSKNVSLDIDYYNVDLINDKSKTENLVQVDLNVKF